MIGVTILDKSCNNVIATVLNRNHQDFEKRLYIALFDHFSGIKSFELSEPISYLDFCEEIYVDVKINDNRSIQLSLQPSFIF